MRPSSTIFNSLPYSAVSFFKALSFLPTLTIASIAGFNSFPSSVSAYSTVGGEVGITVLRTIPSASSFLNLVVNTFGEIPCMSSFNSLKRLGCSLKNQIIFGVHCPPIILRHAERGQLMGGGATLFFLRTIILFLTTFF